MTYKKHIPLYMWIAKKLKDSKMTGVSIAAVCTFSFNPCFNIFKVHACYQIIIKREFTLKRFFIFQLRNHKYKSINSSPPEYQLCHHKQQTDNYFLWFLSFAKTWFIRISILHLTQERVNPDNSNFRGPWLNIRRSRV